MLEYCSRENSLSTGCLLGDKLSSRQLYCASCGAARVVRSVAQLIGSIDALGGRSPSVIVVTIHREDGCIRWLVCDESTRWVVSLVSTRRPLSSWRQDIIPRCKTLPLSPNQRLVAVDPV